MSKHLLLKIEQGATTNTNSADTVAAHARYCISRLQNRINWGEMHSHHIPPFGIAVIYADSFNLLLLVVVYDTHADY